MIGIKSSLHASSNGFLQTIKVAPYCFLKLEKMQVSTSKSVHGYVHIYRKRMKLTLCVE